MGDEAIVVAWCLLIGALIVIFGGLR